MKVNHSTGIKYTVQSCHSANDTFYVILFHSIISETRLVPFLLQKVLIWKNGLYIFNNIFKWFCVKIILSTSKMKYEHLIIYCRYLLEKPHRIIPKIRHKYSAVWLHYHLECSQGLCIMQRIMKVYYSTNEKWEICAVILPVLWKKI